MEFSAEEFETALINPNNTLGDVHMPLLKVSAVSSFLVKVKCFYGGNMWFALI